MSIAQVVSETNQLRAELAAPAGRRDPAYLRTVADRLAGTSALARLPVTQCLIEDLRGFGDSGALTLTKQHINQGRSPHIVSLFDASYFPSLSLDFMTYQPLDIHDELSDKFPSNTCPITLRHNSVGFDARVVVALFPENHIDNRQLHDDRIFYFIDKFVERHQRITQKMIRHVVHERDLALVRNATTTDVERAASHWVWLHEYHHRQGPLPLPAYLYLKSLKPLAGLEELRVDLSALLVCVRGEALPPRLAELTYQFILSERLLRYPVEGAHRPNYDAVSSQLLFNYLLEHGGLTLEDGIIHLTPRLPDTLQGLLDEIDAIESTIDRLPPEQVQAALLAFVHTYVTRDPDSGDYRHLDYFWQIKHRLGV